MSHGIHFSETSGSICPCNWLVSIRSKMTVADAEIIVSSEIRFNGH
ncbi:uncharacterized protein J3R85_010901 [Psidium guajava]|nr:uncharacterized protein J3R85_010901 [Psidium guajava]